MTSSSPPPLVTKYSFRVKRFLPETPSFYLNRILVSFFNATKAIDNHAFYSVKKHFICLNGFRNSLTIRQPMLRICKTFGLKDTRQRKDFTNMQTKGTYHFTYCRNHNRRYATGYIYTSSTLET